MKNGSLILLMICLLAPVQGLLAAEALPHVVISTPMGDMVLELYPDKAPLTVANFLAYVDAGAYDGTDFFRVVHLDNQPKDLVKIEVIQGGGIREDRCRPPIIHEDTAQTGLRHLDGTVSMARGKPGSAQSSFFICINDQPELDFGGQRNPDGQGFAAFGRVISGMELARRIQRQPVREQILVEAIPILKITRQ